MQIKVYYPDMIPAPPSSESDFETWIEVPNRPDMPDGRPEGWTYTIQPDIINELSRDAHSTTANYPILAGNWCAKQEVRGEPPEGWEFAGTHLYKDFSDIVGAGLLFNFYAQVKGWVWFVIRQWDSFGNEILPYLYDQHYDTDTWENISLSLTTSPFMKTIGLYFYVRRWITNPQDTVEGWMDNVIIKPAGINNYLDISKIKSIDTFRREIEDDLFTFKSDNLGITIANSYYGSYFQPILLLKLTNILRFDITTDNNKFYMLCLDIDDVSRQTTGVKDDIKFNIFEFPTLLNHKSYYIGKYAWYGPDEGYKTKFSSDNMYIYRRNLLVNGDFDRYKTNRHIIVAWQKDNANTRTDIERFEGRECCKLYRQVDTGDYGSIYQDIIWESDFHYMDFEFFGEIGAKVKVVVYDFTSSQTIWDSSYVGIGAWRFISIAFPFSIPDGNLVRVRFNNESSGTMPIYLDRCYIPPKKSDDGYYDILDKLIDNLNSLMTDKLLPFDTANSPIELDSNLEMTEATERYSFDELEGYYIFDWRMADDVSQDSNIYLILKSSINSNNFRIGRINANAPDTIDIGEEISIADYSNSQSGHQKLLHLYIDVEENEIIVTHQFNKQEGGLWFYWLEFIYIDKETLLKTSSEELGDNVFAGNFLFVSYDYSLSTVGAYYFSVREIVYEEFSLSPNSVWGIEYAQVVTYTKSVGLDRVDYTWEDKTFAEIMKDLCILQDAYWYITYGSDDIVTVHIKERLYVEQNVLEIDNRYIERIEMRRKLASVSNVETDVVKTTARRAFITEYYRQHYGFGKNTYLIKLRGLADSSSLRSLDIGSFIKVNNAVCDNEILFVNMYEETQEGDIVNIEAIRWK